MKAKSDLVKTLVLYLLFTVACVLGYKVITLSKLNQLQKADYAEINHYKYGLFSVNAWKKQLASIVTEELQNLSLIEENRDAVLKQLELQLNVLIDKINEKIKTENLKSPKGILTQGFIDLMVDVKEIKKGVPEYARAILAEMKKAKSEDELKGALKKKIDHYFSMSYDIVDSDKRPEVIARHVASSEDDAKIKIDKKIQETQSDIKRFALILIGICILIYMTEAFTKKPLSPGNYFCLTLTLLVLLLVGVTTPMIDMEAKISKFGLVLFNREIIFENQILYFQSKSIMDVFLIMITHENIEMKLVGMLLVSFSVIFPVVKMFSSLIYYYDFRGARRSKIVQFFVLKSGKWSMADVLVVAIFMAYIGFDGIIDSQLQELTSSNLNVMSTNGTHLRPGYFIFLTYTILAMFLSGFLRARPHDPKGQIPH